MNIFPPSQDEAGPGGRTRTFPEGFALIVAALFGAVIMLAGLVTLWRPEPPGEVEAAAGQEAEAATGGPASSTSVPSGRTPFPDLPAPQGQTPDPDGGTTLPPDPGDDEPEDDDQAGADAGGGEDEIEPIVCPAEVDPVICDAAEFVQQTRGRPFREFPQVELLADADFDRELLADFDDYEAELEVDDATLTALGLLRPDESLVEVFEDALETGVVGFYDPETKRLVVRGDRLDLYEQLVLVHELVHAFDDQWFDLGRTDFADDEADYGFSAVVEGNATRVEELWREALPPDDQLRLAQEEAAALSPEDIARLQAIPSVVQSLQISPYLDGRIYVDRLDAVGGEDLIDEKLTTPPTSSEEILHPDTDRRTDPEVALPVPPAGGTAIDDGRLGELLIRLWLGSAPAEGWGGDRYVTWREGERSCLTVDMVGDDGQDDAELEAAAQAWAGIRPDDRSATTALVEGRNVVRVSACS